MGYPDTTDMTGSIAAQRNPDPNYIPPGVVSGAAGRTDVAKPATNVDANYSGLTPPSPWGAVDRFASGIVSSASRGGPQISSTDFPSDQVQVAQSASPITVDKTATAEGGRPPVRDAEDRGAGAKDKSAAGYYGDSDTGVKNIQKEGSVQAGTVNPSAGPVSNAVAGGMPTMTTEQANTYYGGQRMAQEAQEATAAQNARVASGASQDAVNKSWDAQQAATASRNAGIEAKYNPGKVSRLQMQYANQRQGEAEGAARTAATTAVTAGTNPNLVQQAQQAHDTGLRGQTAAQGAQTHEQSLQSGSQGLQEGAQKLASGKLDLELKTHMADLQKAAQGGDQSASDILSRYMQASQGKLTMSQEDIGKIIGGISEKRAVLGQPMDPQEVVSMVHSLQAIGHEQAGAAGAGGGEVRVINGRNYQKQPDGSIKDIGPA